MLYVGISDAPAWVVARANTLAEWRGWTPFAGLQAPYSLLNRDMERELLPVAEELGLTVAAWAPLASGVLAGGGSSRVDQAALTERERAAARAVREVANDLGARPAQVALAWIRARSSAVIPLCGMSSVDQAAENVEGLGSHPAG
ncbi:aldo/keto reductase [Streptomyces sp. PT12]|uniref:aldo/keto reductase n=1 Tax=Streptomyces sp. PT12 TaxID=1510197 RepID=UPI0026D7800E|nr:aldo/keto reductase [Streptomyces sp. PT12]